MRKIIICIALLFVGISLSAQQAILEQIEENNTVLSALRTQANAEKIENRTGLNPENPEVGFGYLWGNQKENRTDFEVTQTFDFPTAYHNKRKVADIRNQQVEIRYRIERKDILLEARAICIQLIFQNALSAQLKERWDLAQEIMNSYQKMFNQGDVSILDLNKTKYELLDARKTYRESILEQEFLQAELVRLNGGKPIELKEIRFEDVILPLDFDQWYADQKIKNADLLLAGQEVSLSKQNEKLQRSLNLPKLSAGYVSEKVAAEHFQGVSVGVSIPLWENKNTVKQIKAQTLANQELEYDANLKDYHQKKALYNKALNYQEMLNANRQFDSADNTPSLLKKSLDAGEISLIEFILELGIHYDLIEKMLETEKELHLAYAELMQWEV